MGPRGFGVVVVAMVAGLSGCGWAEWPASPGMRQLDGSRPATVATADPPAYAPRRPPLRSGSVDRQPSGKPSPSPAPVLTAPLPAPAVTPPPPQAPLQVQLPAPSAPVIVRAEPGDTVYALSRRYRVPTRTIIDANGLKPPFRLVVGQKILLPQRRDHVVVAGDTLFSLARQYRVDVPTLASANGLVAPYRIRVGQAIRIPDTANLPTTLVEAGPSVALAGRHPPEVATEPVALPATLPATTGEGFGWPVDGPVISSFGPKPRGLHNDGVNIRAAQGTPVLASENGVVVYAGNELKGFGNLILVRHTGGWVTAYAHAERLFVQRGDVVRKGQEIARVGSTGSVDSPQLHFQLRRGKAPVDPSQYLTRKG